MKKSEMLHSIHQEMALERMGDNIATIAGDVSQLKLDVVTIQDDIAELRQMIKERKRKNGTSNKADKGTQD